MLRSVGLNRTITTVAVPAFYYDDGRPATEAQLRYPWGVALGPDGGLYIGDQHDHRVRKVSHRRSVPALFPNIALLLGL